MNTIVAALVVVICSLASCVNGDIFCGAYYCGDCCCYSTSRSYYCCSCSLAWWAIFLIVLAIIITIAVAVSCGVWRRRVYLARTTYYTTVPATHVVTTSHGYGTTTMYPN